MSELTAQQNSERIGNATGRGAMSSPKVGMVGNGRVLTVNSHGRSVEQVEPLCCDTGEDFCRHPAPRPSFADCKDTARAGDGGENGVGIQWFNGAQVYDFDFPALGGKFVGRPRVPGVC